MPIWDPNSTGGIFVYYAATLALTLTISHFIIDVTVKFQDHVSDVQQLFYKKNPLFKIASICLFSFAFLIRVFLCVCVEKVENAFHTQIAFIASYLLITREFKTD